jgi:uncharacterized protein
LSVPKIIIAGPNGTGNTTFAHEFLPNEATCPIFVNADPRTLYLHRGKAVFLLLTIFLSWIWPAGHVFALDLATAVAAVPNPRAESRTWVADPANAIQLGRDEINGLIQSHEAQSGVEIAVVVLPTIGEFIPKEFATALFNHWGVGKKGQDNGVLVLHVLDQRRVEIETGYGLEGSLPDVKCHWIVEDIATPFFKQVSFSDGHYEIARALIIGIGNPDADRQSLTGHPERVPGTRVDSPPAHYELPYSHASLGDFHDDSALSTLSIISLGSGLFMLLLWPVLSHRHRLRHPDPRDQLDHFRKRAWLLEAGTAAIVLALLAWEWQSLASLWSVVAALPGGFLAKRYRARRLASLRDQPRLDPNTGEAMRRLIEADDDAYLLAGQVCEEKLGSKDYDVWVSPSGFYRVEQYDGAHRFEVCDRCSFVTLRKIGTRIVDQPTTATQGLAEDSFSCAHCGYAKVVNRPLPSLGSSRDDESSSGGGSFDGGSSGGGGAGGSY